MNRLLIAMSGGVDSSAAAAVAVKTGMECAGAYLRLLGEKNDASESAAKSVCEKLGIKFYAPDFSSEFENLVVKRFVTAYEQGLTPNPCLDCNRYVKFGLLLDFAGEMGFDTLVTGHYARITRGDNGRFLLKKAICEEKDQSYVLYSLDQSRLGRVWLPLGEFSSKERVRELAREYGFRNADDRESQDICFVPEGDHDEFIRGFTGKDYPAGDFTDLSGNVLGRHKGIIRYTVGQRKGLGLSLKEPMYVIKKDAGTNTVVLAAKKDLITRSLTASDFNWIAYEEPPREPVRVTARVRYHAREVPALARAEGGNVRVVFDAPQTAAALGQGIVLYDGDVVVGGGTIADTSISAV